jgi:hypothetical protein
MEVANTLAYYNRTTITAVSFIVHSSGYFVAALVTKKKVFKNIDNIKMLFIWRHDTQLYGIQHNDINHNALIYSTQHKRNSE